jgi:hypothetical protein
MLKYFNVQNVFLAFLFITMVLSFYILIQAILYKKSNYKMLYSTWQFPMLLALFMETIILIEYGITM